MSASALLASATHPTELYALFKFLATPSPKLEDATAAASPSVSDPSYSRRMCYHFLNLTSRSFARVIQELDAELRHPICIFYLVLRGLDTVEDDMTIPLERKKEVLQNFHKSIYQRGWTFTENGESEKDRELLVKFDVVVNEFLSLKESYQTVIADITKRMGHGMSDFVSRPLQTDKSIHHIEITTKADYNLYTHYVAGLVGIGLTELFVASGLERPSLGAPHNIELANEMGQFLQKVNILKDFLEDLGEGRVFWPKEVWSKHVPKGAPAEALAKEENIARALACLNELVVDALEHVPNCLEYMSCIQNQTVFQFCAIPQMMAIATLDRFFNDPTLFRTTGTKIRRGLAVKLMLKSGDMDSVKRTYEQYALSINRKNAQRVGTNEQDDSFLKVSTTCAKIVRWIHTHDQKYGLVTNGRRKDSGYGSTLVDQSSNSGGYSFIVVIGVVMIGLALSLGMLPAVQ
ncbi:farnesyl-diphosphate farnesyltransferase [Spizellomyces punctatus DAOM BR117]|uniref:squalene synthase n=1 Tax=Spizellomyces punctatus (strain DAOM BR117) TaxID=645134 RepID=A0A0L0HCF6_SPIPD|nr:farnesyl-diphosphate farnesyltransferase [Spizellomyces punctatus DAOM BR117]KNC98877.1 farnesyl-diphosphate farnesyltransferase [Spizellomyces punctatus DAOM BR117]|eukprot:XP_016606917.1 farnesyl-diphosphate farnesyltransferase [Spizellomyces punctatus DAOM BR117]